MYNTLAWSAMGTSLETSHVFQVEQLKPNTFHSVAALATTKSGGVDVNLTGFKTLHRVIQWRIHKIHILDDSDSAGEGELYFQFHLTSPNGTTASDLLYFNSSTGDDIEVNETEPPFVVIQLKDDTSTSAAVSVNAIDDDTGGLWCLPIAGLPQPCALDKEGPAFGIDNCGNDGKDAACASAQVNNLFDDPQFSFQGPLDLHSSGHSLEYTVSTSIQVVFTP
jgi:hypothetical protein